jgi:hypothetical protein
MIVHWYLQVQLSKMYLPLEMNKPLNESTQRLILYVSIKLISKSQALKLDFLIRDERSMYRFQRPNFQY